MGLGHIVDKLHDKHSLADSGSAKEPNLASTLVGGQKVHHLHAHAAFIGAIGTVLGQGCLLGETLEPVVSLRIMPATLQEWQTRTMRAVMAHLDACHKNLLLCALINEWWSFPVNPHSHLGLCMTVTRLGGRQREL